jgi:putative endonuclease
MKRNSESISSTSSERVSLTPGESGSRGEDRACEFLAEQGFSIIKRNYHSGRTGEIDIIARKDDLILFVEVKNRSKDTFGGAREALGHRQKKHLWNAARGFIQRNSQYDSKETMYRFDLIAITGKELTWQQDILQGDRLW